ncbi:MAG: VOC family protein [bacterium]
MSVEVQITVDCSHPGVLVDFWAPLLGYVLEPPPAGAASWNEHWLRVGVPETELDPDRDNADSVVDPAGVGPRIWFQVVPEAKQVKNRLHLDLRVGGARDDPVEQRRRRVEDRAQELVRAGATYVRSLDTPTMPDYYAVTMLDPEGNEFCLR